MRKISKIKNLSGLLDLASIPQYQNGGEQVVERTLPEIEVYGDQLRKDLQRTGLTYDELSNLNYGAQRQSQIQQREQGVKELAYNAPVTGDVLSLYDVGKDVYEGNYGKAAIGAGLFFVPNIVERPIKNAVRRIGKWINAGERLNRVINIADQQFQKDLYNLENIAGNAEDLISKKEKELIKSNVAIQNFDTDKKKRLFKRFKESQKQYLSDQTLYDALTGDYHNKLDEDSQRLFIKLYQEDPQYLLFAINNDLPINSNSTVQQFAKKQESSLRGAFIPEDYNYDKVYDTLTRTYSGRTGGDRMHSRNGVYISNSRDIQNVFSRRQDDNQQGYAIKAALTTNFLPDASKSISDQLYDLRKRYLDYDIIRDYNPDTHSQLVPYDYLDMQELYDLGYKGIEGQYVRRNGSRLPVYERAMFNPEDRASVLNIDDAVVSEDIENLRGRWGVNASGADYTDKEFVHRSPGGFKDLLGYYRILDKALERIPIHQKLTSDELQEFNTQLYGWWNDKIGKAHDKYNTSKRRLDKLQKTQQNRNKNIKRINKVVNETNKLLKPSLIGLTLYNSDLQQNDPNEEMNNYIERQRAIEQKNERIKQITGFSEGGIHIKKKNRGKFTKSAKQHGMGVQEYARKVVNDPNATTLQKRRAQFAINARKFKH